jgi:hypothetical protein
MTARHPSRQARISWLLLAAAGLITAGLAGLLASGLLSPKGGRDRPPFADADEERDEPADGPPLFRDRTAGSGVAFPYRNGEERGHYAILESLGGGVALIDFDRDGKLDVFLPGGGEFAGKDGQTIKGLRCKLFRNLGGWKFQDVTDESGLGRAAPFYSHGAAVADIDNDGWPDLLVTGWGGVALFRNDRGRFEEVTKNAGLHQGLTWATSAAFADLDGDGYADLYVCQYVNWSFGNHPECPGYSGDARRDICPPRQFDALPHRLYRNNGNGTFTDVSREAGLRPDGKGLGVLVVDVNGDGKPDVYVANDTTNNFLYLNRSQRGRLRFEEVGLRAGVAVSETGVADGSMGVAAADYDGSGRASLWVTNYENEMHGLYRNVGNDFFLFSTKVSGIAAIGRIYVGFGTAFLDVDRDGREDLVITNGHVIRHSTRLRQRPVLLRNEGEGRFRNVTARGGPYFRDRHVGRGLAAGDLDNDGRPDLVITHLNANAALLAHDADDGHHWLGIELVGKGGRDVVGARLVLEAGGVRQTRFAQGGGSYLSSGDRRHLFGLGTAAKVDRLTVHWPSGQSQQVDGATLRVDRYHRLVEGSGVRSPPDRTDP